MLLAWENEKEIAEPLEHEDWQAVLWRAVISRPELRWRVTAASDFQNMLASWDVAATRPRELPPVIGVFAPRQLPPLFIQMLRAAAKHSEVFIYAKTPLDLPAMPEFLPKEIKAAGARFTMPKLDSPLLDSNACQSRQLLYTFKQSSLSPVALKTNAKKILPLT